jgi:putative spermidine/putrescine transport system permease protein
VAVELSGVADVPAVIAVRALPRDRRLASSVRRAGRGEQLRSLALTAPLVLLIVVSFLVPILLLLGRAFYDPTIADNLPRTAVELRGWDGQGLPDDAAFRALGADLAQGLAGDRIYEFAKSLNFRLPGARSHVLRTARRERSAGGLTRSALIAFDPIWGEPATWRAIRSGLSPFTLYYFLNSLDLRPTAHGIAFVPPDEALYLRVFGRTFLVATIVTLATLIGAFPLAWLAAHLPPRAAAVLIILVLLPFWTSILVRTAAWTVVLQKFGLLNDLLLFLHITHTRLDLMYSRLGLILTMTDIQLPFTLLPIYSVLRGIQPVQMRAAYSLGARPFTAFRRVYLPQAMPGIMAGALLTFILCLGYYITPALVGGPDDQLVSNFISNFIQVDLNWHMAAALSFILLALTLMLFAVFGRLVGSGRLRLM